VRLVGGAAPFRCWLGAARGVRRVPRTVRGLGRWPDCRAPESVRTTCPGRAFENVCGWSGCADVTSGLNVGVLWGCKWAVFRVRGQAAEGGAAGLGTGCPQYAQFPHRRLL